MPPRPILSAIAHGMGACALLALVGGAWTLLPFEPDAALAVATVSAIGGLAWLVARSTRQRPDAANDNDPDHAVRFDWQPITSDPTAVVPAMAGTQVVRTPTKPRAFNELRKSLAVGPRPSPEN